ncbi:MAG: HNH endonuclease [Actinomycetia bacterium]|nr:HNH endonuclease [Actinomycetes bacterium]
MHSVTGYGQFSIDRRYHGAHRVSYEWATGEKLGERVIDHVCFNRPCVNPRHLRAVTQKQNNEHRNGAQSNSLSGVRGVSRIPSGKWQASAYANGKNYIAGYFATIEEADAAARRLRAELFTHAD